MSRRNTLALGAAGVVLTLVGCGGAGGPGAGTGGGTDINSLPQVKAGNAFQVLKSAEGKDEKTINDATADVEKNFKFKTKINAPTVFSYADIEKSTVGQVFLAVISEKNQLIYTITGPKGKQRDQHVYSFGPYAGVAANPLAYTFTHFQAQRKDLLGLYELTNNEWNGDLLTEGTVISNRFNVKYDNEREQMPPPAGMNEYAVSVGEKYGALKSAQGNEDALRAATLQMSSILDLPVNAKTVFSYAAIETSAPNTSFFAVVDGAVIFTQTDPFGKKREQLIFYVGPYGGDPDNPLALTAVDGQSQDKRLAGLYKLENANMVSEGQAAAAEAGIKFNNNLPTMPPVPGPDPEALEAGKFFDAIKTAKANNDANGIIAAAANLSELLNLPTTAGASVVFDYPSIETSRPGSKFWAIVDNQAIYTATSSDADAKTRDQLVITFAPDNDTAQTIDTSITGQSQTKGVAGLQRLTNASLVADGKAAAELTNVRYYDHSGSRPLRAESRVTGDASVKGGTPDSPIFPQGFAFAH